MPRSRSDRWPVVSVVLIVLATIAIVFLCASCATPAEMTRMEGTWAARTDTKYVRPGDARTLERAAEYTDESAEEQAANLETAFHTARDARMILTNETAKSFQSVHARISKDGASNLAMHADMKQRSLEQTAKTDAQQTVFGSRLSALSTVFLGLVSDGGKLTGRVTTLERKTDADRAVMDGIEKRAQHSIQELKELGPQLIERTLQRFELRAEAVISDAASRGKADAQDVWMSLGQGLMALAGGIGGLLAVFHFVLKRKKA